MPAPLLCVIQDIYNRDEYVLKDGDKTARVRPTRGVKQGCPLSPLLFSLYINDIDDIAEGVSGAITGTAGVHFSHMLIWLCWLTSPMICKSCWVGWLCMSGINI